MSLRSITIYIGKLLLSGAIFTVAMPIGGLLAGLSGLQQPSMPDGVETASSMLYLALGSPLFALILALLASGLAGGFLARSLVLGFFSWCVYSLNTAIESLAFTSITCSQAAFTAVTFFFPCFACGAMVSILFPQPPGSAKWLAAARDYFLHRKALDWAWRFILAMLVFVPVYIGFGVLVQPLTGEYFRQQMYGLTMPSEAEMFTVLTIRSILFLLACLPVIAGWQKSRWSLFLGLGLGLFILVGFLYMLAADYMPLAIRIPHTLEILADSFVHAGLLVVLLARKNMPEPTAEIPLSEQGRYKICIKEEIDDKWFAWFDGFTIQRSESGGTLLMGTVMDQAALHGVMAKIRDLNLTLISVNQVESKG